MGRKFVGEELVGDELLEFGKRETVLLAKGKWTHGPRSRPKRESYAGVEELHKQKDAQGDNADGPRAAEYSQLKLHGREDDVELLRGKLRQLCQLNPRGSVESEHSGEASCPELILVSGVSG